jgi:hypothetical protein
MPQPLLDLRNIAIMRQGVRRHGRAQRVHTEAVHIDRDADLTAMALHDIIMDRFGVQRLAELAGRVVPYGAKERSLQILRMSRSSRYA